MKLLLRLVLIVVVLVLTLPCVVLTLILYQFYSTPFEGSKFDRKVWLEASVSGRNSTDWERVWKGRKCIRGKMLKDLQENHIKVGVTSRTDVIKLLGEPLHISVSSSGGSTLGYKLGVCSLAIDCMLYIYFDKREWYYILKHGETGDDKS